MKLAASRTLLFLAAGLFSGISARGAAPIAISLAEALAAVEEVNFTALFTREEVRQAVEQARRERAGLLPQLDAQVQQRRTQFVNIGRGINQGETAPLRPSNRFDGKLAAQVPLLDLAAWAAYQAARAGLEVSQSNFAFVREVLQEEVGFVYLTHLRNTKRIDLLRANRDRAQALLRLARNQMEAGVVTQIDVTRAESQVAIAQQAILQQEAAVYASELELKRLLSIDQEAPLQLDEFSAAPLAAYQFWAEESDEILRRRADFQRAEAELRQAGAERRAARFQRLPTVTLFGEYGYASAVITDEKGAAWLAGVSLNVPVFDGFAIPATRRIAASRYRAREYRLQDLHLRIQTEVRTAAREAESLVSQIAVARTGQRLAQEELRLAGVRYEQGVADNREIIDAQNSLARADDTLLEATYRYHLSRLELARARGEVSLILQN